MPIVNPFAVLLVAPVAAVIVGILAALPAYPTSGKIRFAWIVLVLLWSAGVVYSQAFPPQPRVWTVPVPAQILNAVLIHLPFLMSFLLWRRRLAGDARLGARASTMAIIAVCVVSVIAVRQFNKTCVYHDFWHDDGSVWCPVAWQATLG